MDGCFWESQYFSWTTVTISSIFRCEDSLFESNDNMYNKWEHFPILLNDTGRQNRFLILMKEDRALFVSNRSIVLWCKCNECIVILCKAMNSIWFDPDPHNFYISQFHNTLHSLHRSWSPRHVSRLSRVTCWPRCPRSWRCWCRGRRPPPSPAPRPGSWCARCSPAGHRTAPGHSILVILLIIMIM